MRVFTIPKLILFVVVLYLLGYLVGSALLSVANASTVRTIYKDKGGAVVSYLAWRDQLIKDGDTLQIKGDCFSACTLYLSLPPEKLCVSSSARFFFHAPKIKGKVKEALTRQFQEQYPPWVNIYIQVNGGLGPKFFEMSPEYIRNYVKEC